MKRKFDKRATVSNSCEAAMENPQSSNPSHEEIARLAYAYWEARAGRGGSPEEDWYRAEQETQLRTITATPRVNTAK